MTRWSSLAASLALIAGCAAPGTKTPPAVPGAPPEAAAPAPVLPPSGLLLANFDRNVRPQDDLFRFVNGGWLARTEIPADRSNYGSFIILDDRAKDEIRALV